MLWKFLQKRDNVKKYPNILLVRHGETEWNLEVRFQGHLDSPLTPKGRLQAKENGIKLKKYIEKNSINPIIFSSPLGRAKNTAYIISNEVGVRKEDIIFDNRIIEFNYGIFEGKRKRDVLNTKEFKDREANKWHYVVKNGDSYEIVHDRILKFLDSLNSIDWIIIVAHEMVNRIIRGIYCNFPNSKTLTLKQPNSQIFILQNGEYSILY